MISFKINSLKFWEEDVIYEVWEAPNDRSYQLVIVLGHKLTEVESIRNLWRLWCYQFQSRADFR